MKTTEEMQTVFLREVSPGLLLISLAAEQLRGGTSPARLAVRKRGPHAGGCGPKQGRQMVDV